MGTARDDLLLVGPGADGRTYLSLFPSKPSYAVQKDFCQSPSSSPSGLSSAAAFSVGLDLEAGRDSSRADTACTTSAALNWDLKEMQRWNDA